MEACCARSHHFSQPFLFNLSLHMDMDNIIHIYIYYPNLVILPVDNNEHQRIDDVSTDRISYDIRSVETMGFAL